MNVDAKHDHLDRIAAETNLMADPKSYIAHAPIILAQCRDALIKAESNHQVKRNTEIVQFKDRLLRLDADHDKLVAKLSDMIGRLEAFRD